MSQEFERKASQESQEGVWFPLSTLGEILDLLSYQPVSYQPGETHKELELLLPRFSRAIKIHGGRLPRELENLSDAVTLAEGEVELLTQDEEEETPTGELITEQEIWVLEDLRVRLADMLGLDPNLSLEEKASQIHERIFKLQEEAYEADKDHLLIITSQTVESVVRALRGVYPSELDHKELLEIKDQLSRQGIGYPPKPHHSEKPQLELPPSQKVEPVRWAEVPKSSVWDDLVEEEEIGPWFSHLFHQLDKEYPYLPLKVLLEIVEESGLPEETKKWLQVEFRESAKEGVSLNSLKQELKKAQETKRRLIEEAAREPEPVQEVPTWVFPMIDLIDTFAEHAAEDHLPTWESPSLERALQADAVVKHVREVIKKAKSPSEVVEVVVETVVRVLEGVPPSLLSSQKLQAIRDELGRRGITWDPNKL